MAKQQKAKNSKRSVLTDPKRRAYYTAQFAQTEANLKRKGKTNKKNKAQ